VPEEIPDGKPSCSLISCSTFEKCSFKNHPPRAINRDIFEDREKLSNFLKISPLLFDLNGFNKEVIVE
jgi:hypothetical protein